MNKTTPVTPVNPLRQLLRLLLIVCFVYACANKGSGPTGGPKDETPPRVMKSVPENGAMNFAKQEIQVDFDENISLEKVTEEVVVSPPQQKAPDIRAQGKRLVVAFEDTLESGTTYTIDFGNAIVDLNEKNPLSGYTFSFVPGTNLHWPDVMFTYIHELKALVSCDAFGAHFASDAIFLSKEPDKEGYYKALRYYFENIMGPFPSFVIKACDLVEKLDISLILPGHGCIIDENPMEQVRLYRRLAEEGLPVNDANVVTICAASAYGYTKEIAERTARFLEENGKEVHLHIIDALNYQEEKPLVLKDILRSGTFLLGSPTLAGDAIVLFYDILNGLPWTKAQGKTASAFGDYGWSGEAVPNLIERMRQQKCKVLPGFRANFKIDDAQEEEFSRWLASLLG